MLVDFLLRNKYFSAIFDFHFHENPRFRDEVEDLLATSLAALPGVWPHRVHTRTDRPGVGTL